MKIQLTKVISVLFLLLLIISSEAAYFNDFNGYILTPLSKQKYYNQNGEVELLDSISLLTVKFKRIINSTSSCLATIVNIDNDLYLITARYCLYYEKNKIDLNKISEISLIDADGNIKSKFTLGNNENQFTVKIHDLTNSTNVVYDKTIVLFKLVPSRGFTQIGEFPSNIKGTFTPNLITSVFENENHPSYDSKKDQWGLNHLLDDRDSKYIYITPQVFRDGKGNKFTLSQLNHSNFFAEIDSEYEDTQSSGGFLLVRLFYNDVSTNFKYLNNQDKFVKGDIGAPVFKCSYQNDEDQSVCYLFAINVGPITLTTTDEVRKKTLKTQPLVTFTGFKEIK